MQQNIQFECIPVEFVVRLISNLSVQNRIKVSNNHHFPWFSSTAVIFVLVCKEMFHSPLVLVYRPPYSADHSLNYDFFTEFSTYLETILLSKEHLVIAGDLNIHVDVPHDPDSVISSVPLMIINLSDLGS